MNLPSHSCSTAGCNGLAKNSSFCDDCKASGKGIRPSASARGYDKDWQTYRSRFLQDNPYCSDPFKVHGTQERATCVDHIKPHLGNRILFWSPTNHQGLCDSCHSAKTVKYDGGFGNQSKPFIVAKSS